MYTHTQYSIYIYVAIGFQAVMCTATTTTACLPPQHLLLPPFLKAMNEL